MAQSHYVVASAPCCQNKVQVHESLLATKAKSTLVLNPFSILGVLLLPQDRMVGHQNDTLAFARLP